MSPSAVTLARSTPLHFPQFGIRVVRIARLVRPHSTSSSMLYFELSSRRRLPGTNGAVIGLTDESIESDEAWTR